jgi:hypothetical protein
MLQSFTAATKLAVNEDLEYFGGFTNKARIGFGYGSAAGRSPTYEGVDEFFQNKYNVFGQSGVNSPAFQDALFQINSVLRPREKRTLLNYIEDRTRRVEDNDLYMDTENDKPHAKGVKWKTPEQIRRQLGLEEGER